MKNSNATALKLIGMIMIVFGLIYAVVGTLALMGTLNNVLPRANRLLNNTHA